MPQNVKNHNMDTSTAIPANQFVAYQDERGEDCFASPRSVVRGVIQSGGKAKMVADANRFNGGETGMVNLPEFSVVFVEPSELDMMAADLDALQGKPAPAMTYEQAALLGMALLGWPMHRRTPDEQREIERERPGLEEFEHRGCWL